MVCRFIRAWAMALSGLLLSACLSGTGSNTRQPPPNILFVILDDVGIDQMKLFGYGGDMPPELPNMEAVASAGLRFRNTWAMPECSPGRAAMLVGRYPLRHQVNAALGPSDLANSQVSAYELTVPKLLKQAGYESGMFGKFHLAGPEHNPAENGTPLALGWDYFHGWIWGAPGSIDTTAGGVAPVGTYACGFVPGAAAGGANAGACHLPDGSCTHLVGPSAQGDAAGKQCLDRGGILEPQAVCGSARPSTLNFSKANGYYVGPLVINSVAKGVEVVPLSDPRSRGYRSTLETDAAIRWIKQRRPDKPWMATLSFSAVHTPYQQPPGRLVNDDPADNLSCSSLGQQRVLSNKMTQALDAEFGRLLVETGLATRTPEGRLSYDPRASNTTIVIIGDNGTFMNAVKAPFDASRPKATAYQTGVWVPLIVAGAQVAQPGRDVPHMVNAVDLFRLFGELAGLDVTSAVPRTIDSAPMRPYLTQVDQPSIRSLNFAYGSYNLQANGARNGPCLISMALPGGAQSTVCTQSVPDKPRCEDNAGVWWGAGYTDPAVINSGAHPPQTGYASCCQVNQAQYKAGLPLTRSAPDTTMAVRDATHKLVRNTLVSYNAAADTCAPVTTDEFYAVDERVPTPALDKEGLDLLPSFSTWSGSLVARYNTLLGSLNAILASQPDCPGDGNKDDVVDAQDIANWRLISSTWGLSSAYDFNLDGVTDSADLDIIHQQQGTCPRSTAIY